MQARVQIYENYGALLSFVLVLKPSANQQTDDEGDDDGITTTVL